MLFQLREGEAYSKAASVFIETGRPLPEKWAKRPLPPEHLMWVWQAFFELTHSRQIGMGIGGIPFEAIQCYANVRGFDEDDLESFHFLIRKMDGAFLEYVKNNG